MNDQEIVDLAAELGGVIEIEELPPTRKKSRTRAVAAPKAIGKERWLPIPGSGYLVSNHWRVMRCWPGRGTQPGRIVSPQNCMGHACVQISIDGKKSNYRLTTLWDKARGVKGFVAPHVRKKVTQ